MKKYALCALIAALLSSLISCSAAKRNVGMVRVEGGTFMMGSPANEPEREIDEVTHMVTLSPFYIAQYELTQKEYEKIMETNPSQFKGENLPVEMVSWFDAVEYCNKRSRRERLTPAYTIKGVDVTWNRNANGYRLPTEAEWEYACRAGTTMPFSTGNNITTSQANYDGNNPYNNNPTGIYWEGPSTAGVFSPNAWGLYDMHGNVWEWCWDWYDSYPGEAQTDPAGAAAGSVRVLRGGSWISNGRGLRSASRFVGSPFYQFSCFGFRLARNAQ